MGYYTRFELTVTDQHGQPDPTVIEALRAENSSAEYTLNENGGTEEPTKWYDWQNELRAFSRQYPDHLFELRGEGEENDDMWVAYFRNGRAQICKAVITYAEFDETKLV